MSDGDHMIQLVFDARDQLVDCDFTYSRNQAKLFVISLKKEMNYLESTHNIKVKSLVGQLLPEDLHWLNFAHLKQICEQKQDSLRKTVLQMDMRNRTER